VDKRLQGSVKVGFICDGPVIRNRLINRDDALAYEQPIELLPPRIIRVEGQETIHPLIEFIEGQGIDTIKDISTQIPVDFQHLNPVFQGADTLSE